MTKGKLKTDRLTRSVSVLTLLLLLSCFGAAGYAQKMRLKIDNTSLKELLKAIEKQSGYYFLYNEQLVSGKENLTVDYSNTDIEDILRDLENQFGFQSQIVDKTITLTPKTTVSKPVSTVQQRTVGGVVRLTQEESESTEPARGATVTIKGTRTIVRTDQNGHFTIQADPGTILVFSYLGYERHEITFSGQESLEVRLKPSVSSLDEVIVSGYGIREAKENQVGSAYMVTSKDLERRPVQRVDKMLEGLVPGLEISSQDQNNSSVRPRYATRIRGEASVSSISSNEPLWIIDGVRMNTGGPTNLLPGLENSISPLSFLNPEDIETITVLKDASATTIYGADGSNGVILITTKQGTGKSKVHYSYRSGFDDITNNRFQVLSTQEYNRMLLDMGQGEYINDNHIDWYDAYYRNGLTQQHNLSFSGSEVNGLSHYVSAGIYNEKMTIIGNNTSRYNLRTNIRKTFRDRLTFHLITGGSYTINNMFNPGDSFYKLRPNIALYKEDGVYALRDDRGIRIFNHPIEAEQNNNVQRAFLAQTNGGLDFKIIEGLHIRSDLGLEINSSNESLYRSMQNLSGLADNGYARRSQSTVLSWISTSRINYQTSFWNKDEFSAVAGFEANESVRRSVGSTGSNFANDWIREVSYAPEGSIRGTSSGSENSALSYFGQFNYVWNTRYALTATMRRDANSNFGTAVKWATFSNVGLAWTISNESFWPKYSFMDFLKFKASYGNTGNSRFSGNYARGIYSFDSQYAYDGQPGGTMTRGVNDVLKWESTNMLNMGADFRIFGTLNVAAEYYYNRTLDLIDNTIVSLTSGQRRIYQNFGKVENQGLELIVDSRDIRLGIVKWAPKLILSANRNKVLELPEGVDRSSGTNIRRVGYPAGSHYLVRWAGADPRDGNPMWYDINGNITKIYNAANRVIVGSSIPDFYGSFINSLQYKNFSISATVLFTKGGYEYSSLRRNSESDGLNLLQTNQSRNALDYWKAPGDLALNPRLSAISTSSSLHSTRYLHDKTHIRVQNASLNYSLKESQLRNLFIDGLSVYVQADNLGFWTPYQQRKDRNTYRNSFSSWPEVRSFSIGANVIF